MVARTAAVRTRRKAGGKSGPVRVIKPHPAAIATALTLLRPGQHIKILSATSVMCVNDREAS